MLERGKTSWEEVKTRARMYGISDQDIYSRGVAQGWSAKRRAISLAHPFSADLLTPLTQLPLRQAAESAPFLAVFTSMRYAYWLQKSMQQRRMN